MFEQIQTYAYNTQSLVAKKKVQDLCFIFKQAKTQTRLTSQKCYNVHFATFIQIHSQYLTTVGQSIKNWVSAHLQVTSQVFWLFCLLFNILNMNMEWTNLRTAFLFLYFCHVRNTYIFIYFWRLRQAQTTLIKNFSFCIKGEIRFTLLRRSSWRELSGKAEGRYTETTF